jgi:hypothetical protein
LNALKAFFTWLSQQRGFKSKFTYVDAEYFALSLKDTAIAKAARGRPVPSIEQIRHVALTMPCGNDVEKRDRALIALTLLTGARDDALASLRVRHVAQIDDRKQPENTSILKLTNFKGLGKHED